MSTSLGSPPATSRSATAPACEKSLIALDARPRQIVYMYADAYKLSSFKTIIGFVMQRSNMYLIT